MDTIKNRVQEVINNIFIRDGEVRPTVLIEEAKSKTSPIHDAFEWNNQKAGHEYRLIQARNWIRRVTIVVENRPERLVHVPKIEANLESSEGYYKPISVISKDKDEYRAAMAATLSKFNSAKFAYEELKQAAVSTKEKKLPNFRKADKGFRTIEAALDVAG